MRNTHLLILCLVVASLRSIYCAASVERNTTCEWNSWGPWGSCNSSCGGGLQFRKRQLCCESELPDTEYIDDCGLDEETLHLDSQKCNEICLNDGNYTSTCHCPYAYYGQCCEKECPGIPFCKRRQCSTPYDTTCLECYDDSVIFKRTYDNKTCERMCAWNNHYCWPGTCEDGLTKSCHCAAGFRKVRKADNDTAINSGETSCQPDEEELLLISNVNFVGPAGNTTRDIKHTMNGTCSNKRLCNYYGHFLPNSIHYAIEAVFEPDIAFYSSNRPNFITEEMFGIIDFHIHVGKRTFDGQALVIETIHNSIVDDNYTSMKKQSGNIPILQKEYNITTGEELCLLARVTAGGYLRSIDTSNGSKTPSNQVKYTYVSKQMAVCFTLDDMAPLHCISTGKCTDDPLRILPVTRVQRSHLSFHGWNDPEPNPLRPGIASGISYYEIAVHEVHIERDRLVINITALQSITVSSSITEYDIHLPYTRSPMVYQISLTVADNAGNFRYVRRLQLFDNTSFLEIGEQIKILSASPETNYTWQTLGNEVCFTVKNCFFNPFYTKQFIIPFLRNINAYEYGESNVSLFERTNLVGILELNFSWSVNGGQFSDLSNINMFINNSESPKYCNQMINFEDGDTLAFKFMAVDIANNSADQLVQMFVDMSMPDIELDYNGTNGNANVIVLNANGQLKEEILKLHVKDVHSGLRRVFWTLGILDGPADVSNGRLHISHTNPYDCWKRASECYCPQIGYSCELFEYHIDGRDLIESDKSKGKLNETYNLTITATNNAMLTRNTSIVLVVMDLIVRKENESISEVILIGGVGGLVLTVIVISVISLYKRLCSKKAGKSNEEIGSPAYEDSNTHEYMNMQSLSDLDTINVAMQTEPDNNPQESVYESLQEPNHVYETLQSTA